MIDDVFENANADVLQQHINKAITQFQQKESGRYKSWIISHYQTDFIKHTGGGELF